MDGGITGFVSYAQVDDYDGRISQLVAHLKQEFSMITGDDIRLFFDRNDLDWGDNWRNKIDESIAAGTFFIPILTPRYFKSPECRRELQSFAQKAKNLGVEELILPVLYVNTPLLDGNSTDETANLIGSFQWEDWRDARLVASDSEQYRRAVAKLAERLARANATIEQTDISLSGDVSDESEGEEAPGTLDLIAKAEVSLPQWTQTIQQLSQEVNAMQPSLANALADVRVSDGKGSGAAGRLKIFKRLSIEIDTPATNIELLGRQYTSQLHEVDEGVKIILNRLPAEIEENQNTKESAKEFHDSISGLVNATHQGLGATEELLQNMKPLEFLSKDLRKQLRKVRKGLTLVLEGRQIIDGWVAALEPLESQLKDIETRQTLVLDAEVSKISKRTKNSRKA